MKIFNALCLISVFLFSGCSEVKKVYAEIPSKPVNVVIGPGYKVDIEGEAAYVFGSHECPKNDPLMVKVFGQALSDGKSSCVVITPETKAVKVMLVFNDRILNEQWEIIREEEKKTMYIKRPNGSPVGQYIDKNKPVSI